MKVDAMLRGTRLAELAAEAREREAAGIDGLWSYEGPHDPFLPLMPGKSPSTAARPHTARSSTCTGWGELGVDLNRLSRGTDADRWQRMGQLIDNEVLATFAVVAEPDRLGAAVLAPFGGLVDRFTFYAVR